MATSQIYGQYILVIVFMLTVVMMSAGLSFGLEYVVGDSIWTIPPTNDFYTNWSSTYYFETGDTLLFEFDPELENVLQVSRREYDSCTADNPFQGSTENAPLTIYLMEQQIYYFICSIPDHCSLGQKFSVVVHDQYSGDSVPPSSSTSRVHRRPQMSPQTGTSTTSYTSQQAHPPPNVNVMDRSLSVVQFANACRDCSGNSVGLFISLLLGLYFVFV